MNNLILNDATDATARTSRGGFVILNYVRRRFRDLKYLYRGAGLQTVILRIACKLVSPVYRRQKLYIVMRNIERWNSIIRTSTTAESTGIECLIVQTSELPTALECEFVRSLRKSVPYLKRSLAKGSMVLLARRPTETGDENEIVGYRICEPGVFSTPWHAREISPDILFIHHLETASECRGQRIQQALGSATIDYCVNNGLKATCGLIVSHNRPSILSNTRLGASRIEGTIERTSILGGLFVRQTPWGTIDAILSECGSVKKEQEMRKTAIERRNDEGVPMVTVVMPVRNEARFIARSLGAVLAQDYPAHLLEVIVADGMSTDGTRDIIKSLQVQHRNLRLIDNAGQIVPTGLNAALARMQGRIFARVDGHCEIDRDYVSRCVEHLENDGVDGVGGPLETVGETGIAKVISVAMSSKFGVGNSAFRTVSDKTMLADTIAFPAYTRAIVERVGLFDEELVRNQDDDYNYRLRKIGAKILLAADVRSRYYSRSSIRSLWRQYFQYGYWKVRVLQKHPRQMRPRQFVPPLFAAALLFSLLMVPFSAIGVWMLACVAGSYALANVGASVITARKLDWGIRLLLPPTFAILHLAFGSGFLFGLIRFWNRWETAKADGTVISFRQFSLGKSNFDDSPINVLSDSDKDICH